MSKESYAKLAITAVAEQQCPILQMVQQETNVQQEATVLKTQLLQFQHQFLVTVVLSSQGLGLMLAKIVQRVTTVLKELKIQLSAL